MSEATPDGRELRIIGICYPRGAGGGAEIVVAEEGA